jgi:thiosulfate/3-mercaptopyruvate sulfurtransferase
LATYAKDVLVEPDWLQEHLLDDSIRVVEVDENPALYGLAHIPGAIGLDWRQEFQDQTPQLLRREEFAGLLGRHGVSNEHLVILYGDRNNWFAAYVYWYLKY